MSHGFEAHKRTIAGELKGDFSETCENLIRISIGLWFSCCLICKLTS